MHKNVVVEIVEQPAKINERFRYECESKSVILGANSTVEKRTYPAIRVLHYTGSAIVVVSCISKDEPYRQHPHSLLGKNCCKGVCKIEFKTDESAPTTVRFKEISVQCCRKADIKQALTERETLRIDPFKCGFRDKSGIFIDLTALRLCFQVILKSRNDEQKEIRLEPVPPIVSNIIYDKKYMSDLLICDISDSTSPATGGKKIMLFCNKVVKSDIKIRFFRENADKSVAWEAWGQLSNVHRQVAIAFKTPAYQTNDISEPENVYVQLVRPSDGRHSLPLRFQYVPDYSNVNNSIKKKKRKIVGNEAFYKYVQGWAEEQRQTSKRDMIPNIECNPVSHHVVEGAEALPVMQSNLNLTSQHANPNPNRADQSYKVQNAQQSNYNGQNCSSYPLPQQPQANFSQTFSQHSQHLHHGHFQHSQFQPQSQYNHTEFQPLSHQQQSQFGNYAQALNEQPPPFNGYHHNMQQQQQQYHPPPSNFHQMFSNTAGYDQCSSSVPFNPYPDHCNAAQMYDSRTQNMSQLCANNGTTMVNHQQQIVRESNVITEDNPETLFDSLDALMLGPV